MKKKKKKLNIKLVILAAFVLIVIIVFLLRFVIFNNSTSKYGNRLNDIKNNVIDDKKNKEIVNKVTEDEKILNTSVDVKGKILNIMVTISDDVSKDDAKKIADASLYKIDEKIKNAYDIQIFISKKTGSDDKSFPIIGYKNTKSNKFVW